MPRYALDQAELLRLVILAVGADVGTPDEAMAILRRAEYVPEVENDPTPADEPVVEEEPSLAPAPFVGSARLIEDGGIRTTRFERTATDPTKPARPE